MGSPAWRIRWINVSSQWIFWSSLRRMKTSGELQDAIVIGGGPGGSTAATLLARSGRRILLLEREHFPRFHIGESLLPYNRILFEEMGVLPALEAAGFPRKFGAQFHLGNGLKSLKLRFRDGRFTREPMAFQVERSVFDHILLRHSRSVGADVREGWKFLRAVQGMEDVTVEASDGEGVVHKFQTRFLIDASGRSNITGNQEGLRVNHPRLRKISLFGHFKGVELDDGERAGDMVIVRLANKWFWLIPVSSEKVSVGCVMDRDEFAGLNAGPREIFDRFVTESRTLSRLMKQADLVGDFHTTSDFSYHNKKLVGSRLLRVGDAAGFLDPIFSSGVYLAMYSARLAARAVDNAIHKPSTRERLLGRYEKEVRSALGFYWEMVEGFYTTPFMELFLEPRKRFSLPAAVNAALAGEPSNRWALRWRMRLFFWLVRLQSRRPIVPQIHFT